VDQAIGFIGTPEKVIRQIRDLQSRGGIGGGHRFQFRGLEHGKSIKTQQLSRSRYARFRRESATASKGRRVKTRGIFASQDSEIDAPYSQNGSARPSDVLAGRNESDAPSAPLVIFSYLGTAW